MLLCKPLDFAGHNVHLQVSVEVIVSNVAGCIDHVPEYFVLEALYNKMTQMDTLDLTELFYEPKLSGTY